MDYALQREDYDERRRKWRRSGFWRGVLVTLALLIGIGAGLWHLGKDAGAPHLAEVRIEGLIVEDDTREALLDDLARDPAVRAVVLRVSSPGGTVVGSEQLYEALRRLAAEKPMVAVMGEMAASGGLIAALAADHVIARETTLTGSIGVLMEFPDFSGLLGELGVGIEVVRSQPLKGDPSPTRSASPEALAALQAIADDADAWFRGLVAARRGYDAPRLQAVATGAALSGRRALEAGLIDGLGGIVEARAHLNSIEPGLGDLPLRLGLPEASGVWGTLMGALPSDLGSAVARLVLGQSRGMTRADAPRLWALPQ